LTEVKDAPLSDLPCRIENPDFDLTKPGSARRREVEMHVGMLLEPTVVLGLMGTEIVNDGVQFVAGIGGDDLVHEGEELDPPPAALVGGDHLAGDHIQRPVGAESGDKPNLAISREKVCHIVFKVREFDVKDLPTFLDDGSDPPDEEMRPVLRRTDAVGLFFSADVPPCSRHTAGRLCCCAAASEEHRCDQPGSAAVQALRAS